MPPLPWFYERLAAALPKAWHAAPGDPSIALPSTKAAPRWGPPAGEEVLSFCDFGEAKPPPLDPEFEALDPSPLVPDLTFPSPPTSRRGIRNAPRRKVLAAVDLQGTRQWGCAEEWEGKGREARKAVRRFEHLREECMRAVDEGLGRFIERCRDEEGIELERMPRDTSPTPSHSTSTEPALASPSDFGGATPLRTPRRVSVAPETPLSPIPRSPLPPAFRRRGTSASSARSRQSSVAPSLSFSGSEDPVTYHTVLRLGPGDSITLTPQEVKAATAPSFHMKDSVEKERCTRSTAFDDDDDEGTTPSLYPRSGFTTATSSVSSPAPSSDSATSSSPSAEDPPPAKGFELNSAWLHDVGATEEVKAEPQTSGKEKASDDDNNADEPADSSVAARTPLNLQDASSLTPVTPGPVTPFTPGTTSTFVGALYSPRVKRGSVSSQRQRGPVAKGSVVKIGTFRVHRESGVVTALNPHNTRRYSVPLRSALKKTPIPLTDAEHATLVVAAGVFATVAFQKRPPKKLQRAVQLIGAVRGWAGKRYQNPRLQGLDDTSRLILSQVSDDEMVDQLAGAFMRMQLKEQDTFPTYQQLHGHHRIRLVNVAEVPVLLEPYFHSINLPVPSFPHPPPVPHPEPTGDFHSTLRAYAHILK